MTLKRLEDYKLLEKTHTVYEEAILNGRVIKTQSGFFTIETPQGNIISQIAGTLKEIKEDSQRTSDLVALGDLVTVERQKDGSGIITAVQDRQHVLSRVAPSSAVGTSAEAEQIIIANCDQAIFVFAATQPDPQPRMLDRLLVVAEKAELESTVICINKIDLLDDKALAALQKSFQVYADIGYTLVYTSVQTQTDIAQLRALLQDKVSVFTGASGVGKSSLLNAIQTGLQLQTGEISTANTKGRHTTRFSQLIPLEVGGYVADTPGIRAIAPWDVEPDELDSYFREFAPLVTNCRFADCSHIHEPGCAVRTAVQAGQIVASRYDSYLRLREEIEEQYVYL